MRVFIKRERERERERERWNVNSCGGGGTYLCVFEIKQCTYLPRYWTLMLTIPRCVRVKRT